MPSSRFFKLPDEKRSKILRAVHSELAEFPVDELSINRIIHSAGISRGSFYQYFEDKDDLLEYVFSDFRNSMIQEIKASIEVNCGDMFAVGMDMLEKIVATGSKDENRRIFVNVFSYAKVAQSSLERVIADEEALVNGFVRYIDRSRLKFTSDEEVRELMKLGLALFKDSICRCFADIDNASEIMDNFRKRVEIIKYGAWKQS